MLYRTQDIGQVNNVPAGGNATPVLPTGWSGAAVNRLGGVLANAAAASGVADQMQIDLTPTANLGGLFDWLGGEPQTSASTPAVGGNNPGCANCSGGGSNPSGPAAVSNNGQVVGSASGDTNWGPEDEKFLEEAIGGGGGNGPSGAQNFDHIMKEFGQTTEGNCASVACIKAALDKYGTKVFQQVSKAGDGYAVSLQDGKKVQVSKDELRKAAQAAKFKGKPNQAKSMAVLMYAVMAKQAMAEGHEGARSFDAALKTLANGEDPKRAAKFLGLGNKIKDVPANQAGNTDGAVAWNGKHAVYVDKGSSDSFGTEKRFDGTDTRGGRLTNAFVFV